MSSWLTWISILINSIIPIISIQFLLKLYSKIIRNVGENAKQIVVNQQYPINKETAAICERCKCVINKKTTPSSAKNYHNKDQTKYQTFGDESFKRCGDGDDDGETTTLSSSDDDHNIIGQVSTREVISYVGNNDRQSENNKILEVCRTKNTVSKLRKQFEDGSGKKKIRNIEKKISERFFNKEPSPIRNATKSPTGTDDVHNVNETKTEDKPNNDYYVIEKTKVYKVLNNNKENVKGAATGSVDKLSKLLLSKRSYSNGDIKRAKKSPSHNVIAEEPIFPNERTSSCDNIDIDIDSDDIEYRKTSAANNRRSVRTFDDILQQERFSKCYSEYSISDLLNDLPDVDDDTEFTSFFNKIK